MTKQVVSIYGYGRFGKLWAEILSTHFDIQVYSRRGIQQNEVKEGIRIVSFEQLFNCDVMFFCVAISAMEEVLAKNKDNFKTNCLYIDTCSVKVYPVQWMKTYLPSGVHIIGTHPMFGPDSYYKNNKQHPIVLSNINASELEYLKWLNFFKSIGLKVEEMTPDEHDKIAAYSQGITHYIGRVLSDLNLKPNAISTMGYQKLLDIIQQTCNDDWQLFLDLQYYNPYTKNMRKELHNSLEKIYSLFENK